MQGQYHLVLREELPKILAAFKQISPKAPYKPTLTIAICGKRHHARFWPTAPGEANMTNNGNTVPGTVVDKGITDVYNFDFYLQVRSCALMGIMELDTHRVNSAPGAYRSAGTRS